MLLKAGVDISRLKPPIRRKLSTIQRIVIKHTGEELIITSTYEGNHVPGSLHYINMAIDIRSRKKPNTVYLSLKAKLGKDYEIIAGKGYIHIGYDPK